MIFRVVEEGGKAVGGRGRRREGTWKLPLGSAPLGEPTPCGSALPPPPGHAPPEPLAVQSPRSPLEPSKHRPRRMGSLGPTPPLPTLLLLLMLGKSGRCLSPQPRPAGACYLAPSLALLYPQSPSQPPASSGALPDRQSASPVWVGIGTPALGPSLRHSEDPPRCQP